MSAPTDDRRNAPAALRNRDLILDVVRSHLPVAGLILEIASGSGQHAVRFGEGLPDHIIQPSDPNSAARASIDAWARHTGIANVRTALALDAMAEAWPIAHADAILCINMIHIAPWAAARGLLIGSARLLPVGGVLYLYGPFKRDRRHTAASNEAFDATLRKDNPEWGVRDLEAVTVLAAACGFAKPVVIDMPANNLSLVFRRNGRADDAAR